MNNDSRKNGVFAISAGVFILFWILTNFIAGAIIALVVGFLLNKLFKKKPELEKHWKVVTAGLFILIIVTPLIRAANNDAQMREEKADIVSGQSDTYSYITPADSYERSVETTLIGEIGKDAQIKSVEIVGNTLSLEYVAKDNLSTKMIRQGIIFDIKDIMQKIAPSIPENVDEVNFSVLFDLVDQYGNADQSQVVRVVLNRQSWEKINWDGFLVDNLPNVSEIYWVHPALQK